MTKFLQTRPTCIGFIMDGNRRYATEQGLAPLEGHRLGKEKLLEVIEWAAAAGIPHVVVYAFSTENWGRNQVEVTGLLGLFEEVIKDFIAVVNPTSHVRFVGRRDDFSVELQAAMQRVEDRELPEVSTTVWIALSYGGRAEIVAAVNKAIKNGVEVDESTFATLLWTQGMPDPDLIVRTGGEMRLSNFLPWQSVYSELFFSETYWPAFTKAEFMSILELYATRERRRGK